MKGGNSQPSIKTRICLARFFRTSRRLIPRTGASATLPIGGAAARLPVVGTGRPLTGQRHSARQSRERFRTPDPLGHADSRTPGFPNDDGSIPSTTQRHIRAYATPERKNREVPPARKGERLASKVLLSPPLRRASTCQRAPPMSTDPERTDDTAQIIRRHCLC